MVYPQTLYGFITIFTKNCKIKGWISSTQLKKAQNSVSWWPLRAELIFNYISIGLIKLYSLDSINSQCVLPYTVVDQSATFPEIQGLNTVAIKRLAMFATHHFLRKL